MAVGDFFSDAWNVITHPADDVSSVAQTTWTIATHPADDVNAIVSVNADDFVDALQAAPGGQFLAPDVRKFVDGPLRDFAKSAFGSTLLSIFATAEYYELAPFLGPQWAAAVFATPGLFSGDAFGHAWLAAFVDRVEQTAKILSAGNLDFDILPADVQQKITDLGGQLTEQVGKADAFLKQIGAPDLSKMTYDALAKQLSIRLDAATAALVKARNNPAELAAYQNMRFDPATGNLLPPGVYAGDLQQATKLLVPTKQIATKIENSLLANQATVKIAGKDLAIVKTPAEAPGAVAVTAARAGAPAVIHALPFVVVGGGIVAAVGVLWWFRWRKRTRR